MNDAPPSRFGAFSIVGMALLTSLTVPLAFGAAAAKKNPTSKFFVTDIQGGAEINTGEKIEELTKKSSYTAQGMVIQVKEAPPDADKSKYYSTMVYSNGTAAHLAAGTRMEVQRFVQEPFTPNRTDMDVEPSISQTQTYLAQGSVSLCTSKPVAGSSMVYQTSHGAVNVRGQKVVIETNDEFTRIVMLEGDSTVRGGAGSTMESAGQTLNAGEQALIRSDPSGQASPVRIEPIPERLRRSLEEQIAMACAAKKTVYFDDSGASGGDTAAADGAAGEIRAYETVPGKLPIQFTISPAQLPAN